MQSHENIPYVNKSILPLHLLTITVVFNNMEEKFNKYTYNVCKKKKKNQPSNLLFVVRASIYVIQHMHLSRVRNNSKFSSACLKSMLWQENTVPNTGKNLLFIIDHPTTWYIVMKRDVLQIENYDSRRKMYIIIDKKQKKNAKSE